MRIAVDVAYQCFVKLRLDFDFLRECARPKASWGRSSLYSRIHSALISRT